MMKIIAHLGYWIDEDEKNTLSAFSRALDNGFGIEIDKNVSTVSPELHGRSHMEL